MNTVPARPDALPQRRERWLPLRSLLDVMRRPTAARVALAAGVDRRTVCRWLAVGEIPEARADRACCSLGLHPGLVFRPAWWDLAQGDEEGPEAEPTCDECGLTLGRWKDGDESGWTCIDCNEVAA